MLDYGVGCEFAGNDDQAKEVDDIASKVYYEDLQSREVFAFVAPFQVAAMYLVVIALTEYCVALIVVFGSLRCQFVVSPS